MSLVISPGYPQGDNFPLAGAEKIFLAMVIFAVLVVAWAYWKD